jgi:hypothetical protein
MKRIVIALLLLAGSTYAANAAWTGAAGLGAAAEDSTLIARVACDYSPQGYCPFGSYLACRGYQCWCASCGGYRQPYYGRYSYGGPQYYYRRPRPGVQFYFGF